MNIIYIGILAALLSACAPKSVDEYKSAESDEEIVRLLNQREYGKAVWLIESKHGKAPADQKASFLLAQAYLGKAGFEPLQVAARVSGPQKFDSPEAKQLFPGCSEAPIHSTKGSDVLCFLKRLYLQTPDADIEEMDRARNLLRNAYPSAESSPEAVNVLIGAVETASCVKRTGRIYLLAKQYAEGEQDPSEQDVRWLGRQAERLAREGSQALQRANHSGKAITQMLTGNREAQWFQRAREGMEFADQLGISALIQLLAEKGLHPEDREKYKEILQRIRALLEEKEKLVDSGA